MHSSALPSYDYKTVANQWLEKGEKDRAIQVYLAEIEAHPETIEAYMACAQLYHEKGEGEKARALGQLAFRRNPESQDALNFMLEEFLKTAAFSVALKALDHFILHHPQSASLYVARAFLLYNHDKLPESLADYNQALTLDAHHVGALYWRARVHARLGHPQEELNDINQALQEEPHNYEHLRSRMGFYSKKKHFYKAVRDAMALCNLIAQSKRNSVAPSEEECSWYRLSDHLQLQWGALMDWLVEYDALQAKKACVYGVTENDKRYAKVSRQIRERLAAMDSQDTIHTPPSLFAMIGLFVDTQRKAKKPDLTLEVIAEMQKRLSYLS